MSVYPIDTAVPLTVAFDPGDVGLLTVEFEILDDLGAVVDGPINTGIVELGGGQYGTTYTFPDVTFDLGDMGWVRWRRSPVDVNPVSYDYQLLNLVGVALPGERYYDRVVDNLGNALQNVDVRIYKAGTATLLETTQTDAKGEYFVLLDGALALLQLVDIELSAGGIQTVKKTNLRLI